MTSKTIKLLIPIILLVASLMPVVYAPYDTASPTETADDAWITGIGAYFGDTPHLTLQDENVDIISGIRFRGVSVPQGAKINNATLFVRSVTAFPIGAVTVTIYGDDADDSAAFNDSGSFTRVYTLANSVWDVSDLFGVVIGNETITEIVQEIVDRPGWSSGNSLSLLILGTSGSPRRTFSSFDGFWEKPWIEIFYDVEPTPEEIEEIADEAEEPYNKTDVYVWEKNDTYRGIDIYNVTQLGAPEFQYVFFDDGNEAYYQNSSSGTGGAIQIDENWSHAVASGATSPILSIGEWTLIMGDPGELTIYISDDEFLTNISYIPNDEYSALANFAGNIGSLAIDRQNETLVHLVYTSVTPAENAVYNIIYTNFTLDLVTGVPTFAPTFTNITQRGDTQIEPVIHVQDNGTLHVVWYGVSGTSEEQVWYRRRHTNETWLDIVRVSDTDVPGDQHAYPDVVANNETGVALVVWEFDRTDVYWDVVYPNNTDDVDRTANTGVVPSMLMDRERNEALMVWSSALGQPATIYFQNKTIDNSTAWSANKQVSPGGQKHFIPDIGLETYNDTIQVIWQNDWNLWVSGNFWNIPNDPIVGLSTISTVHGRHNFIEEEFNLQVLGTVQFLVWPNGTLVTGDPLPDDVDPKDAIDELLGGAQPEDPQEEEYAIIGKFRWKLLVLAVGMIMMLGAPIAGVYYGGDTATWIKILFIMFFGLGILWQIKSM